MPRRKTHDNINSILLGKAFSEVNQVLDLPAKVFGPSHRRFLHTVPEAFLVGVLLTGEIDGGIGGVLHVIVDSVDSKAKKEIQKIIRKGGGGKACLKRIKQKRKKRGG